MKSLAVLFFGFWFCFQSLYGQDLLDQLKALPGVKFATEIEANAHFSAAYHIGLRQPLDHAHPEKGSFIQQIYLFHADAASPMVMETEGYAAGRRAREISIGLSANQLNVEHRYHGSSIPQPLDWTYLNAEQAAADLHRVRELFRELYPAPWLSSGISKGGENTLLYRHFYPEDVAASVAYVAPLIHGREDPRVWAHVNNIGKKKCREAVVAFQREMLLRRAEMLLLLKLYAEQNQRSFERIGYEKTLEYAAMEFPFSFWQWGGDCKTLPGPESPTTEFFDLVQRMVSWDFYCDSELETLAPSYYQHSVELGYYGFDATPVKDLIRAVTVFDNTVFAPQSEDLRHDPTLIRELEQFLDEKGDRILYVYGGYDTWGACAYTPPRTRDAYNMTLKKGDHRTRIHDFPVRRQKRMYRHLLRWLKKAEQD